MGLKFCKRCILHSEIPQIEFDEKGVCNYCKLHDQLENDYPLDERNKVIVEELVNEIKSKGRNNEYDCIVGFSGGTDSSYALYLAKKYGLRPLAVHFDNGWNTETAVNNIKLITNQLGVDLFTYVVDWEEFKDLQLSVLKSSISDVELPTDLGIHSVLYKVADEHKIKYILTGISFRTEGNVPSGWDYGDGRLLRSIHKIYGTVKLNSYPLLTLSKIFYYIVLKRIKVIRFLNYFDYSKESAIKFLEKDLGWKYYGGHHYESIFTRYFQGYIAPKKHNVDYRFITLSAAVRSGHISREEAMRIINTNEYPPELMESDKKYVAKKLEIDLDELEKILKSQPKSFNDYKSYFHLMKNLKVLVKFASKFKLIPLIYHKNKY